MLREKIYSFSYFDKRFKRFDSITNINGDVIHFIDGVDGLKFTGYDEDSDSLIDGYNETKTTSNEVNNG